MISALAKDIAFTQLPAKTNKSILGQVLFVSIALIIPTITHKLGINYAVAQPMHWMVLFAGLTYGAISGALLGALIPILSFFLSGMPIVAALPLMIPELLIYGLISGLLKKQFTSFGSMIIALLLGKITYVLLALTMGRIQIPVGTFIANTWGPGVFTIVIQIIALPILSGLYINWINKEK